MNTNIIKENRDYATKREYAIDLFKDGWSKEDVAELLEITFNTSKTYYQQYRKEQGLVKERGANKEEVKETVSETTSQDFEKLETIFEIGNETYAIDYYKDLTDGTLWFNFMKIIEAIKKENVSKADLHSINIPKRYFRDEFIENKLISLIDKNALADFAREVGDFTLMSSVVKFITDDYNYFYKFGMIVESLELMENYIRNIDNRYHDVRAFNDCQSDILHEIDNNQNDSMEERFNRFERLEALRHARREVKNELVLSQTIRGLFKYHNADARNINFMSTKLNQTLRALYNKNYNPRVERLDEMQRDLVEKVVQG